MVKNIASRPGFRSSEWYVAFVTAALNLLNTSQNWVSYRDAIIPSVAAVAYIVSRGLAKYEPRNEQPPAG